MFAKCLTIQEYMNIVEDGNDRDFSSVEKTLNIRGVEDILIDAEKGKVAVIYSGYSFDDKLMDHFLSARIIFNMAHGAPEITRRYIGASASMAMDNMRIICDYLKNHNMWDYYLAYSFACNLLMPVSEIITLRWKDFYDTQTGEFQENINRHGRGCDLHINMNCRNATAEYIKNTNSQPSLNGYNDNIFPFSFDDFFATTKKVASEIGLTFCEDEE